MPTYADLCSTVIDPGSEPHVYCEESANFINREEALSLIFRKIGSSNKGDVFQLEGLDDKLFHGIQIGPTKSGPNIHARIEDLVYVHYEEQRDKPLCYASKNPSRGLNYYALLGTAPFFDGQQESPMISPYGGTYSFASIEFDYKAKVGRVNTIYKPKEYPRDEPTFTLHQCNPKVWVVKRRGTVCAAFNLWKGLAKLTCWRVVICKGEDPILMSLLLDCIDSFLPVAKSQWWKFTHGEPEQNIDFPPMDPELSRKLFGR